MNDKSRMIRETVAFFAIAAALVGVGAHWLISPKIAELHATQEQYRLALEKQQLEQPNIGELSSRYVAMKERAAEIQRWNQHKVSDAEMYDLLLDLGQRADLIIERITPGAIMENDHGVQRIEFGISAVGPYLKVIDYLDTLFELPCFSKVTHVRLSPQGILESEDNSTGEVSVDLNVEFIRFSLPEALAQVSQ